MMQTAYTWEMGEYKLITSNW